MNTPSPWAYVGLTIAVIMISAAGWWIGSSIEYTNTTIMWHDRLVKHGLGHFDPKTGNFVLDAEHVTALDTERELAA